VAVERQDNFHWRMGYECGRRGVRRAYLLGLVTGIMLVVAWASAEPARESAAAVPQPVAPETPGELA
jgi:hypothetical protein